MSEPIKKTLLPERHPTPDFFVADIFDNLPLKDDLASMEHPIFSLSKKKDLRNLKYENKDVTVEIKPNTDGLPTIFDKDVLLYCGSLLMNELNQGSTPPKTLRISSHDLLIASNRTTDGRSYTRLKQALDRLTGVTIKTNIKTNKREITSAFGLIERYEIIESSRIKDRMIRLEITLSDWFYNSIIGKEVLTLNRDYFRLGRPIERRLYEIARKHCGKSSEWKISLEKLRLKSGSTSSLNKFRFTIRTLLKTNHLPDYLLSLSDNDLVTFKPKKEMPLFDINDMPNIKRKTIEKGQGIVAGAGTGWDYGAIREQFTQQLITGYRPDKVDGAFINFIKKKVSQKP
jgi:plasmid replication initiation protein